MSIKDKIMGFIGDTFLTSVAVKSVENVSRNFRLITLHADAFGKVTWKPGEKVQINTGNWNVRTYTPLSMDKESKELKILAFLHGNGPGSKWASQVKAGDSSQILGPRSSLSLPDQTSSLVLFGDETSLAVAATFRKHLGEAARYHFVFEVADPEECQKLCERIGILQGSTFVKKTPDRSHLAEVSLGLKKAFESQGAEQVVLTGDGLSIRDLSKKLREGGISSTKIKAKIYWSEGKEGID